MPNFDGAHGFLTALFPVRRGLIDDAADPEKRKSHVETLREELTALPTAVQSTPESQAGLNSPFARDPRTHFARFVVLEDVIDNGRPPQDAILNTALGPDLTKPLPTDDLKRAYLIFTADFDAPDQSRESLDGYLRGLWRVMAEELTVVFSHCEGFDEVSDAQSFARYVRRGQVTTTMSFNDYWVGAPPLKPVESVKWAGMGVGLTALVAAAAGAAAFVKWSFGAGFSDLVALGAMVVLVAGLAGYAASGSGQGGAVLGWLGRTRRALVLGGGGVFALALAARFVPPDVLRDVFYAALILTGLGAVGLGAYALWRGSRPFPAAPNSDLASVLKALYLQAQFRAFVAEHQCDDPQTLYRAFGEFIKTHKPKSLDGPTQPRGVVPGLEPDLETGPVSGQASGHDAGEKTGHEGAQGEGHSR